ncbi:MAG: type II toxin-antitoxin system RelE/ParE family toxin [Verrucomicrobiota bacterium]
MNPEAVWTARAEADLLREFARREEAVEGSGTDFLSAVDSTLRLLRINPEMAPRYSERYHRLVLRDRRIGIFYSIESRGVIVLGVCDLRQDRATILRHLST